MVDATDNAKSPLQHVWRHFVPQGHDQALRNAFYNVAAAVFVGGAAAAAWSVYIILQPFVQALLWAVLCGSVLHPLKFQIVTYVRKWLQDVQETKSLLSFSVTLLPVMCLDNLSEYIGRYVMNHMQGVIAVTIVLPLVYLVIHHTPSFLTQFAYWTIASFYYVFQFFLDVVAYLNYVVIILILVYCALVIFCLSSENKSLLRRLSFPVWLMLVASASCLFPSVSVVFFLLFILLLITGVGTEVSEILKNQNCGNVNCSEVFQLFVQVCSGSNPCDSQKEGMEGKEIEGKLGETNEECTSPSKSADPSNEEVKPDTSMDTTRPQSLPVSEDVSTPVKKSHHEGSSPESSVNEEEMYPSLLYIKTVFLACILVELWRHKFLLSLLPIAFGYYMVKKATSYHLFGDGVLKGKAVEVQENAQSAFWDWFSSRKDILIPPPLICVFKLLKKTDHRIAKALGDSVDAVSTILIIFGFIIFLLIATIFLAVQIQGEGMQLVAIGSQMVNSTFMNNSQILELLPKGWDEVVESAVDNGYVYGREWLANMIRSTLGETNDEKTALLEKQILELWDRVYQAWVVPNPTMSKEGPVVTSAAVALTFDSVIDGLMQTPGLISLSTISDVVRDNLGTVMSVLEGLWTILLSNLNLVFSATTAIFSSILGGSLSILNALLNMIVFLSSLFYVVSISDRVYKPVAMLSALGPGQMYSMGSAVEDSVNSVFKASFKMGAFYGLWTWLLHSLFGTNIVYIPSVLGALFGAVPLLGTYWAAIPGALELVWLHGSPFMGVFLMVAQLLPMSCVDTAVYSEIKGGGHPYLTGLAVAGGIFCWGVQGAIFGPLLLCILLVITKVYSSLIQSPTDVSHKMKNFRRTLTIM